jgi:hypothetical protein
LTWAVRGAAKYGDWIMDAVFCSTQYVDEKALGAVKDWRFEGFI